MRTRVEQYWYDGDWRYKVEKYIQVTGDEVWVSPTVWYCDHKYTPAENPKVGDWYWSWVWSGGTKENALRIAKELSSKPELKVDQKDIIAEFDEALASIGLLPNE